MRLVLRRPAQGLALLRGDRLPVICLCGLICLLLVAGVRSAVMSRQASPPVTVTAALPAPHPPPVPPASPQPQPQSQPQQQQQPPAAALTKPPPAEAQPQPPSAAEPPPAQRKQAPAELVRAAVAEAPPAQRKQAPAEPVRAAVAEAPPAQRKQAPAEPVRRPPPREEVRSGATCRLRVGLLAPDGVQFRKYYREEYRAGDQEVIREMIHAGVLVATPVNTQVEIERLEPGLAWVRVLEGEHAGLAGWARVPALACSAPPPATGPPP